MICYETSSLELQKYLRHLVKDHPACDVFLSAPSAAERFKKMLFMMMIIMIIVIILNILQMSVPEPE